VVSEKEFLQRYWLGFEQCRDHFTYTYVYMINRYWTTSETLTEIERDCKERQLCMWDWGDHCVGGCYHGSKTQLFNFGFSSRENDRGKPV